MKRKGAIIILSDKCNAECQICYSSCSPKNTRIIDENLMINIINQVMENREANTDTEEYIGFTGGEPFLHYELLKKGLNYAKELGFKTAVFTNAFWGKWCEDELREKFLSLPIDHMTISTDYYHEKYIPEADLSNAIIFAKKNKIPFVLKIGETKSQKSASEYFKRLGSYKYLINLKIYPFIRAGRAAELAYDDFYHLSNTESIGCIADNNISFRYDGEVFRCSEFVTNDTSSSLGNINEKKLFEILSDSYNNALLSALSKKDGLCQIAKTARDTLNIVIPEPFGSGCEVCHTLFKDKETGKKILSLFQR